MTHVETRDNCLNRINSRGKPEPMAANLSQLLVVVAPLPKPDLFLIDHYLCAAELLGCHVEIVLNKTDLTTDTDVSKVLDEYRQLGYPVIETTAIGRTGVEPLRAALSRHVSVLVGQSGVGKSSLINALIQDANVAVGDLSSVTEEGRHTTSAAIMYELDPDCFLVDSPGVREYVPFIEDPASVANGFREIGNLEIKCRFANCQHSHEPDCAVKIAVDAGRITARRFESYRRLLQTIDNHSA